MSIQIFDFLRGFNPDFSSLIFPNNVLYLMPNQLDIYVKSSAGQWQPWTGNPLNTNPRFAQAVTIPVDLNTGSFSVTLPWTDTECYRQAGGTIQWQLWDPLGGQVYQGSVGSADYPGGYGVTYSIKDLLSTMGTDWAVVPPNNVRGIAKGSKVFNASLPQEIVVYLSPPMATANYTVEVTGAWDDLNLNYYNASLKTGSRTTDQFTIRLIAVPAGGRTVEVFWRAED